MTNSTTDAFIANDDSAKQKAAASDTIPESSGIRTNGDEVDFGGAFTASERRETSAGDRLAVESIFQKSDFDSDSDFERFKSEGIRKDEEGRVVSLLFSDPVRTLPPDIGKLTELKELDLSGCAELSSLPSQIGNLGQLEVLSLEGCDGLETLPPEIAKLGKLKELNLTRCCSLTTLPTEIGKLMKLKELELYLCSKLCCLPSQIGQLGQLQVLSLKYCSGLVTLPPEIAKLGELKELHLQFCSSLTSLPPGMGRLMKLNDLDLSGCGKLTAMRSEIGELGRLQVLSLEGCDGLETLPPEMAKLGELKELNLQFCSSLTSIPLDIGQLTKLYMLKLSGCDELVSLPSQIGMLRQLQVLRLQRCSALLCLPPSIGRLTKLEELNLRNCKKLQSLPADIGKLRRLKELNLFGCKKLQSIPPEIGKLKQLKKLDLDGCNGLDFPPSDLQHNLCEAMACMRHILLLRTDPRKAIADMRGDLRPLFAAAETYPSYAKAIGQLIQHDKTIANQKDKGGRTLLGVSCKEVAKEIRAALFFYRRYEMEDRPKYESDTCKVFLAVDHEGEDEKGEQKNEPVALKFMNRKEHLDAELQARRDKDNNSRFDEDYVVADLSSYNDSDEEFAKAAANHDLPPYCLVLEQGERNLQGAILSENVSEYPYLVRFILNQLGQCLLHLHERGYIHGDFKPKNAIRETHNRRWQLIDFDSAVKVGEPMGRKVSTAFLPPEFVQVKNRKPILRALCACSAVKERKIAGIPWMEELVMSTDDVIRAHESVDIWSFGAVAYQMLARKPLFDGADNRDNLDEKGLRKLSRWSERELQLKLQLIPDKYARDFLSQVLHPNHKERPCMADILEADFFNQAKQVEKLKNEKHELEASLRTDKMVAEKIGDVNNQLAMIKKEILMAVTEEGKRTREAQMVNMMEVHLQLSEISHQLSHMQATLKTYHLVTTSILASLQGGVVPRYMVVLPAKPPLGFRGGVKHWSKPNNWVNKDVNIYFICPITLKSFGEGYPLQLPRDWVKKYGPALRMSLTVLNIALGIGRLAGLPIPRFDDLVEGVKDTLNERTEFLTSFYENLTEELDESGLDSVTDYVDQKINDAMDRANENLKIEVATDYDGLGADGAIVQSYKEIAQVVSDQNSDSNFERSGLILAEFVKEDGSLEREYVGSEARLLFENKGRESIGMDEDELEQAIAGMENVTNEQSTKETNFPSSHTGPHRTIGPRQLAVHGHLRQ